MSALNVIAESPSAAPSNRASFEAAAGGCTVPAGNLYLDESARLTAANNGLRLNGNGSRLAGLSATGDYIRDGGLSIRPGFDGMAAISFAGLDPRPWVVPVNQVGWTFNVNGLDFFNPGPVTRYTELQHVPLPTPPELHWMRAYHGVPFTIRDLQTRLRVSAGHGLKAGDVVFATDGPWINELRPQWFTIERATATSIYVTTPLRTKYEHGTICAGAFPHDMRFSGLAFHGGLSSAFVQQAFDLYFTGCTFEGGQLSIVGCGAVSLTCCKLFGQLQMSSSHDVTFNGCTFAAGLIAEQCCQFCTLTNCTFAGGSLDSRINCTDWILNGGTFSNSALFVYENWNVAGVTATNSPVTIRGRNAVVRKLTSDTLISTEAGYQGAPPGNGRGITLDGIMAPAINLGAGTSGAITNTSASVLVNAANAETARDWTRNGKALV